MKCQAQNFEAERKSERDRERKRQRDRERKRQRDREKKTERERDREKRQRDREAEGERGRETERNGCATIDGKRERMSGGRVESCGPVSDRRHHEGECADHSGGRQRLREQHSHRNASGGRKGRERMRGNREAESGDGRVNDEAERVEGSGDAREVAGLQ